MLEKRRYPWLTTCVVAVITLFMLFPILWMVISSFKAPADILTMPPRWFFVPTLDNYRAVLFGQQEIAGGTFPQVPDFPKHLTNSVVIALTSTGLALLVGCPAAYALARFRFRRSKDLSFYVLSIRMAPPFGVLIPFYILFSRMGLLDTRFSLIVVYLALNLPFVVWMMRSFFSEIPRELEEASMVDGCTRWGGFGRVALPLALPGLAATAIFCLIMTWNEFLFALILTGTQAKTAAVALYGFVTFRDVLWGPLFAAGTIVSIPVLIFTLLVQKNLVRGLTMGAIK